MRSKILPLLKYGLGIGLLVWVIGSNWQSDNPDSPGLSVVFDYPIRFGYLALAFAVAGCAVSVTFYRWFLLVRAQGLPFTLRNAFRLGLVGFYFNTFLPGAVGGDLLKAWFIAREQTRRTVAIATVIADRAIGLWGLVWMVALLGLFLRLTDNPALTDSEYLQWMVRVSWWIVGVSLAAWLAMGLLPNRRAERLAGRFRAVPKIGGPLSELWLAVWLYRRGANRAVFVALGLSLISHAGFVMAYHLGSRVSTAPGYQFADVAQHFLIVPVTALAQALPLTPGGVGVGENTLGWLYQHTLGKSFEAGVLCMLVFRLIQWALGFSGYLVYLVMRARHVIPEDIPEEIPELTQVPPLGQTNGDNGTLSEETTPKQG